MSNDDEGQHWAQMQAEAEAAEAEAAYAAQAEYETEIEHQKSINETEAEKAAREKELLASQIAYQLCGNNLDKIGERFELARDAAIIGLNTGVEWERKRIRDTYCPSYVLAPTMANQGEAKLCHLIPVGDLDKEKF